MQTGYTSLHLTCGKIVSLVNSVKLILTLVIKLIKHAIFINKVGNPSKETTNGLVPMQTACTSLHLPCGKNVSLVNECKQARQAYI